MAAKFTPQQSPQAASSSFWQLISGVAHDLDLMLQDLFPDSIPSPLREEYGLTNDLPLDETFANHSTLLEQFMRGVGNETCPSAFEDSGGEYRCSKSVMLDTPTSDSYDGRTTPTSNSSPSPPPPAPPSRTPHLTDYSSNMHCMASGGGGGQLTMVSSSSVSSVQETSDGDSSHTSSSFAPCDIGLLERLIRTHPIWFLPGIGRAGAVHLLQGKDIGNFIVRQSSKPNTMALSVRLPENKGPYVEHYLIETVGDAQLRLEGSDNNFHAIPMLVAHYCQCCDELPVQLALPRPLDQAGSRQELSSLALLGQDFWLSSLVHSPMNSAGPSLPGSAPAESVPHSTFKPPVENIARSGPSPPNSLVLHSLQKSQENHDTKISPGFSSPPPPIAPKFQNRGSPPPPPPRSFLTSRTSSCANIPSPCNNTETPPEPQPPLLLNNNECNKINNADSEKKVEAHRSKVDDTEKKGIKKIPRVAHYKQSDIVDLPPTCYRSSLADKISDYEDIWGNTFAKDSKRRSSLRTFHSVSKNSDFNYIDALQQKKLEIFKSQQNDNISLKSFRYTYTQGTQTDTSIEISTCKFEYSERSESGIDSTLKTNDSDDSCFPKKCGFPSPFYSEPVDGLPIGNDAILPPIFDNDVGCLPQRLFNHRFSDPNLHWPQNSALRKVDTLDEERLSNLSSSVDNIKGLGPLSQHRRYQNLDFNSDWVQELHNRVSGRNSLKKDRQTQVSPQDLNFIKSDSSQTPSPKKNKYKLQNNSLWPLDSSWEWLAHENSSDDDMHSATLDSKFPIHRVDQTESQTEDSTTVQDIITLKSPELALPDIKPLTHSNLMRVSEYDNLGGLADHQKDEQKLKVNEVADDTATEFSEPWDSLRWERLLRLVLPETDILGDDDTIQREKLENRHNSILEENEKNQPKQEKTPDGIKCDDSESVSMVSDVTSEGAEDSFSAYSPMPLSRERNRSFQERLEPLLDVQRVVALRNKSTRVGENIRQYIFRLSEERNNTFAMSIENFIQCTKESNETNPMIVMRNIRQFMSGMRNYLVKHGEGQFEQLVLEGRCELKSNEFLNVDTLIENALHRLVIKPLKGYIYQLFVNEYTRNGSLKLLSDNIKFARTKTPEELGVRPEFKPPEGASLEVVQHFFNRLQQAYSPLEKLSNLLSAISTIYNSVQQDKITQGKDHMSLGTDDFLPIFICVLVRCGLIAAEIEADYMWGLLHPSLMDGEAGYYLTTLSSAIHVLKSLQACSPESPENPLYFENPNSTSGYNSGEATKCELGSPKTGGYKTTSPEPKLPSIADLQGFMKVMIPDEFTGSIISKTLPVKPNMTTKEVVKMIAHKFNVTNPQDYCLFKLVNGEETLLGDNECPQTIKGDLLAAKTDCLFAYKRCDAKFIWPMMGNS